MGFPRRPPFCGARWRSMDFSRASMNSGVPRGRPVCVHWRRAATSTSDSPAPRYSRHADAVQRSRHGPISSKTSAVVAPQCAAPLDRFHSWRVVRPIAKRRAGPLTFFHHKRLVSAITDLQPPVDDNEDRPVAGTRCARHQDAPRSCPSPTSRRSLKIPIWDKKRASARRRNHARSEKCGLSPY